MAWHERYSGHEIERDMSDNERDVIIHSDTRHVSNVTFSSETLGETWAIMSVTIHQRYTACLKRDIFGRDMSDSERDDTPAIHGVSQTWHFWARHGRWAWRYTSDTRRVSNETFSTKFHRYWAIHLSGHNFVWPDFGCIMAPHLGRKLRNAIAFTQTSKITHINTHIPR
jgi:hypothetical protein